MQANGAIIRWQEARAELLLEEKAMTRQLEKLAQKRRDLPMVEIDEPSSYIFHSITGTKMALDEMFEGRRQLILYHQMPFSPSGEGCGGCAFFSDHIPKGKVLRHLHSRNTTFAVTAPEDFSVINEFCARMDWEFPFYSSKNTWSQADFWKPDEGAFRLNCFVKEGDRVYLTWDTTSRGVEPVLTTYALLDMTKLGRQDDAGCFKMHDEY